MRSLIDALFTTHEIDEVEQLAERYLPGARAKSGTDGYLSAIDFDCFVLQARIHEVRCNCAPCWEPVRAAVSVHSALAGGGCHRFQRARVKTTP